MIMYNILRRVMNCLLLLLLLYNTTVRAQNETFYLSENDMVWVTVTAAHFHFQFIRQENAPRFVGNFQVFILFAELK